MIHRGSEGCAQRLGVSGAMSCALAPLAPPLGLSLCPGAHACMGILGMLVLDSYSTVSQRDREGYSYDQVESRIFKLQNFT